MERLATVAVAALLWADAVGACDDHHGQCEIEDWRWSSTAGILSVEGVTSCDAGMIRLRLYDGEDGPFVAIADGVVEGHAFQAVAFNVPKPGALAIKYSIEPE